MAIVVLVAIVAILTGFVNLSGRAGEMPRVAVEGGRLPAVNADVGSVDVGTTNTTVEVPKVETERRTVELPKVEVRKPQ
ncbi:hypothetical protein KOF26_04070 [Sphingomonas sp. XMGL2]|uniref:Uncharacterized protein n=1 Tax=Sphingomonas quercus TaxID=2842451 RepID=A0ABS6BFH6_9SPHN|nr:hypothetical protein [Sphingomonas quercus]